MGNGHKDSLHPQYYYNFATVSVLPAETGLLRFNFVVKVYCVIDKWKSYDTKVSDLRQLTNVKLFTPFLTQYEHSRLNKESKT